MILIAAADRKWGIGKNGDLLVSIPRDKKLFMQETLGKVIVMGRKTFESLPAKQPLYGRENVILSATPGYQPKGTKVFSDEESLLSYLKGIPEEKIYVIGGESIYRLLLPYCTEAHITALDYVYDADRFMPDLDKDPEWKMTEESEEETIFDLPYTFRHYVRVSGGKKNV